MLKVFNYPVRLTVSELNCAAEPLRVVSALIRLVIFSSFFSLLVTFDSCNYDGLQHTRSFPPPPTSLFATVIKTVITPGEKRLWIY